MVSLNNEVDVEYIDNMWLHFHGGVGLVSVHMDKKALYYFTNFLRGCRFQDPGTERSKVIGNLKITSEGPDENHFNIIITCDKIVVIFGIEMAKIYKLIAELEESVETKDVTL